MASVDEGLNCFLIFLLISRYSEVKGGQEVPNQLNYYEMIQVDTIRIWDI